MYLEKRDYDKADKAAIRSIQIHETATAYLNLGDSAFIRTNYEDAKKYYIKASSLSPKYHMIFRNIGDCYAMLGDKAKVRTNYTTAAELLADDLKTDSNSGSNWMTLAFYHAKLGNFAASKDDLRKAETQGASDVESQFTKAQALALLGKKEDALTIVLSCLDKGLSPLEVDLALDLADLRKDPRYKSHLAMLTSPPHRLAS